MDSILSLFSTFVSGPTFLAIGSVAVFGGLTLSSLREPKAKEKEQDKTFVWIKDAVKAVIAEQGSTKISARVLVRYIGMESSRSVKNSMAIVNLLQKHSLIQGYFWRNGKCYLNFNTAVL